MALTEDWQAFIQREQNKSYFQEIERFLAKERAENETIFPLEEDVYSAFSYSKIGEVKVVILGQDPYHGEGQAHGLAFSVKPGIKVPPSLRNMYKELESDIPDFKTPEHGYLTPWAKQGVLLLNTVLTVRQAQANSHAKIGWQHFTDAVIEEINLQNDGCVFILWGSHAQKKASKLDKSKHLILKGPHPSPLSAYRGFFGCKHFSQTNEWLVSKGQTPIEWQV